MKISPTVPVISFLLKFYVLRHDFLLHAYVYVYFVFVMLGLNAGPPIRDKCSTSSSLNTQLNSYSF